MTRARDVANLQSGAIINEAGADLDFRIESDDNPNMFFVDGGNDKVGIGGTPTAGTFHIFGTSTTDQVIIENTNTGGSSAPDLVLFRKSTSSAADSDVLGRLDFRGLNDANEEINYATIFSTLVDASDGTENGKLTIQQRIGSSYVESFTLNGDGNVGIGDTSPSNRLSVVAVDGDADNAYVATFQNQEATDDRNFGVLIKAGSTATDSALVVTDHDASNNLFFVKGNGNSFIGGNLGIGSSSPQNTLHLEASSGARMRFVDTGTQAYTLGNSGTSLTLNNASQSTTPLTITTSEAVFNDDSTDYDFRVESNDNSHMFYVDAGNNRISIGAQSSPQTILHIKESSDTKTQVVLGHPSGGNEYGGFIRSLSSTVQGLELGGYFNGTLTNQMRIDVNAIYFGTATSTSAPAYYFSPDSGGGSLNKFTDSTNSRTAFNFGNPNGTVGSIATSGSATAYNTSSDYRLKENVVTDWDATSRLKQLKPSRFNFKADKDTTVDGFLAHEVSSIVPEAITGTKDEVDEDGNAVMQGIDQSKLVPLLVKTIQELEVRIAKLEG